MIAAEQKARLSYDNILRLLEDPDIREPIKFLREREIVHFQRFGDANRTKLNRFSPVGRHLQGIFRSTFCHIQDTPLQ